MFQHILCPTDLADRSLLALEKAVQLAHQFGAKITLLNIHAEFMNKEEREMLRVSVEKMKKKFAETAIQAREKMKEMIHDLHADDVPLNYMLREGKPSRTIPEVAKEVGADLIVIATDGRDNIADFVAGTITEHVINHSPCPVLVIPYNS
ncbi:MAG: universal stress protein [Desulfobacterales bacterium]|jgi:nucleotide-binding universal stress UspA family protein